MKIILFFFIILIIAGVVGSQITQVKNPYVISYTTWAFGLILFNLLISLFLYSFRHNVLNSEGQQGLKGKIGLRGEEGPASFCNFCLSEDELENMKTN